MTDESTDWYTRTLIAVTACLGLSLIAFKYNQPTWLLLLVPVSLFGIVTVWMALHGMKHVLTVAYEDEIQPVIERVTS